MCPARLQSRLAASAAAWPSPIVAVLASSLGGKAAVQDQKLNHKKLVFFIKISVLKDEQASSQTNDSKEHD